MIRAVLLDIDNTLLSFDGYVKLAMKEGFEQFGLGKYEEWMYDTFTRINLGFWHEIEAGRLDFAGLERVRWNAVFKELGMDFDGPTFEKYFRECLNESAIPMEGAMELLAYLEERYIICSCSNGPWFQQTNRLKLAGMLPFFRCHFISEEIGASKPSMEFFNEVKKRLKDSFGIEPSECAIIGDSLSSDMAGGRAAGMTTIYYNPAGKIMAGDETVDHMAESLLEIKTIL